MRFLTHELGAMRTKATIVQGGQLGEGRCEEAQRPCRPRQVQTGGTDRRCPDLPNRCHNGVVLPLATIWVLAPWPTGSGCSSISGFAGLGLGRFTSTSAVDHGRAWGCCLPEAGRAGNACWISPRKFAAASLGQRHGVMAVAGDSADQANWALALLAALLLLWWAAGDAVCCPGFAWLAASLTLCSPALAAFEVDFTLDLPLAATATLALWFARPPGKPPIPKVAVWSPSDRGGPGGGGACSVKQSALLVLLAAVPLGCSARACGARGRRLQVLVAPGHRAGGSACPGSPTTGSPTIGGTPGRGWKGTTEGDSRSLQPGEPALVPRVFCPSNWAGSSLSSARGRQPAASARCAATTKAPRQSQGKQAWSLPALGWLIRLHAQTAG